jgi:hypothetical protein
MPASFVFLENRPARRSSSMSNSVYVKILPIVVFMSIIFSGFLLSINANADMPEVIAKDFSPLSGVVVMVENGEIIVDLDESGGLAKGDLLSVMAPGEKLVHPVTGKVLGNLEKVKGILKVTRVKDGFSYTRGLQLKEIKIGDTVRRYEKMSAIFWDYTGEGKTMYLRLRDDLSHMNWMEYDTAQKLKPKDPAMIPETEMAVVFILKDNSLQVRDPEFLVIREYTFSKSMVQQEFSSFSKEEKIMPAPAIVPVYKQKTDKISRDSSRSVLDETPKKDSAQPALESALPVVSVSTATPQQAVAEGVKPVFQDSIHMGQLPGGPVFMADFLPDENGLLLATTDGQKIRIFHVTDKILLLIEKDSPIYAPILSLSWWTPQHSSSPMLAIVNWLDDMPASTLFSWDNNRLQLVKDRIPRFIAAFDTDGDRMPETLLGQEYDPQEFFSYRIQELKLIGNDVEYKNPSVKLPKLFTVFGGILSDFTGDGVAETAFIRNEILYIYSGKDPIFKSSKKMGGSLSKLTYKMNPEAKHIMTNSVSIEIPPIAVDLDGNGISEMIAVSSDRNLLSKTGISSGVESTWLTILKYEDNTFKEGTIGEKMGTPIQGMTVFEDKLFLVVSETGSVFSKGGQSRLMQLPLAR